MGIGGVAGDIGSTSMHVSIIKVALALFYLLYQYYADISVL